jgi:glutamate racemase
MIGVFDSGVGGLTVVKEIFKYLPKYQIIYFGDTARLPYGTKGADFVKQYSSKITQWLLDNDAKVIVIACHTSSSWAGDFLKEEFKNIPIFDMINPALKEVLSKTKNKKIGIIGTPGTIRSNSWKNHLLRLDPSLSIYSRECPLFVPLVEEGWVNKKITKDVVKEYLKYFKDKNIDTLVLACTHYPILEKIIKKEIKANIINPAESLAKDLKIFLDNNPHIFSEIQKGSSHKFFFSDEPYNLKKISNICLKKEIKVKILDPFK